MNTRKSRLLLTLLLTLLTSSILWLGSGVDLDAIAEAPQQATTLDPNKCYAILVCEGEITIRDYWPASTRTAQATIISTNTLVRTTTPTPTNPLWTDTPTQELTPLPTLFPTGDQRTITPIIPNTATPTWDVCYVNSSLSLSLNIRTEPVVSNNVIGGIYPGTQILCDWLRSTATEQYEWVFIKYGLVEGWVVRYNRTVDAYYIVTSQGAQQGGFLDYDVGVPLTPTCGHADNISEDC